MIRAVGLRTLKSYIERLIHYLYPLELHYDGQKQPSSVNTESVVTLPFQYFTKPVGTRNSPMAFSQTFIGHERDLIRVQYVILCILFQ